MIRFKEGIDLVGLRPETALIINVVAGIYAKHDADLVITSLTEGRHSFASLHYLGCAFDCRIRDPISGRAFFTAAPATVAEEIRDAVGRSPDVDVIAESTHIHVEFQPKRRST